jgi:hypothetical protein
LAQEFVIIVAENRPITIKKGVKIVFMFTTDIGMAL